MKTLIACTLLLCLGLSACVQEEPASSCTPLQQKVDWKTYTFKPEFTIQLPDWYHTPTYDITSAPVFAATRSDSSVILSYAYNAEGFGAEISLPVPKVLSSVNFEGLTVHLDQKAEFCVAEGIQGILFYREGSPCFGEFYWLRNASFKAAVNVQFEQNDLAEVKAILATIQRE